MKKGITFALTGLMVMTLLTGCGSKKSQYLYDVDYSKYVKLCDYKNIEVEVVDVALGDPKSEEDAKKAISDEEVEEAINEEMYDYIEYNDITDRDNPEIGDYVNIDFVGTLDGKEVEDYTGQDDIPLGQEYFYPEVEEQMLKQKVGDTFECKVTLDEDFAMNEEEIGKELNLKVTINSISEEIVPELTDEFVKENIDYDSVDEYKKETRRNIYEGKIEEYKNNAVNEMIEKIVADSKFDGYPQELYDKCEEEFNASNEEYASQWGMEVNEFLEAMGMDEAACKEAIEDNVKYELVFGALAIAEGLDCSIKEINDYADEEYTYYGFENKEDFLKNFSKEDIGYMILCEKVSDTLFKLAKKNTISEEEYLDRVAAEEAELYDEEDEEGAEENAVEAVVEDEATTESASTEAGASEEASTEETTSEEVSSEETASTEASTEATTSKEAASTEKAN